MRVLIVLLFSVIVSLVHCKEYVPVLVWSTQTTADSYPEISALRRLSSNEFSDYLLKRVKVENPTILLFVEENLSVEDFSFKDVNDNGVFPQLSNLTKLADDVAFLPSVHDPYRAMKKLKNHGYVWRNYEKEGFETLEDEKNAIFEVKLSEAGYFEDRPDMLKKHDNQMAKVYSDALNYKSNIMVVYTGNHSSWIDGELERVKREDLDNDSSIIVISDAKNMVRITATSPIVYYNGATSVNIASVIGVSTIRKDNVNLTLTVKFQVNSNIAVFDFRFTSEPSQEEWWTLDYVEIQEAKKTKLFPSVDIGAPANHSFFCNPTVVFSGSNLSLTFENFQVQPRLNSTIFGPVIHCIPFFSIAIWSGLVVVLILSIVLAWGITMIMDINTNDRFDDPKGKTITISATD